MSDEEFGPHTALVRAEIERQRSIAWLAPDAEMDALAGSAADWLHERLDEHFAALAALRRGPSPLSPRVETYRSIYDVAARMLAPEDSPDPLREDEVAPIYGMLGSGNETFLPPLSRPAAHWLQRLGEATNPAYKPPWEAQARAAIHRVPFLPSHLPEEHPMRTPWLDTHWSPTVRGTNYAAFGVTRAHLRWLVSFGTERPSPWAPLLALFERGVYPLVASDGTMVVWVPLRARGGLVPDAVDETEFAPRFVYRGSRAGNGHLAGFARHGFGAFPVAVFHPPAPGTEVAASLQSPFANVVGISRPIAPLSPARPPAAVIAVLSPAASPAEPEAPLPWYRRLFKRTTR